MESMMDGQDLEFFGEACAETEKFLGEPITIRRFLAASKTPLDSGIHPKPTFTDEESVAFLLDLGIGAEALANENRAAGDIELLIREQLSESTVEIQGDTSGDRVIYRGAEYRMVQRQIPHNVGQVLFYRTWLRRTNASNDKIEEDRP